MKKLKYIIVCLVLLAGLVFYSFVDKMNYTYDKDVDNSEYVTLSLEDDSPLTQSFVCGENSLDGIALKYSVSGDMSNVDLKLVLRDGETNKELTSADVDTLKLKNGKFNKIRFEKIENCKGRTFIAELIVSGCNDENRILVYRTRSGYGDNKLKINNEAVEGSLILKTITHRFDIETFIVSGALIAFIIVYLRVLYKLFK